MQRSKLFFLQYKTYSCASLLHVFVSTAAKRVRLVSRLYYNNLQTSAPYTLSIYIFLSVVKPCVIVVKSTVLQSIFLEV